MHDFNHTAPFPVRKWTDDLDQFGGVQRTAEPLRTLAIVTRGDYDRPTGPVDEAGIKRELSTYATRPLNLRPRRQRGWWARLTSPLRDRSTRAYLLRMHP